MTAPFEDREGWEMNALALDGSVYLEQFENRDNVQYSYKWVLLEVRWPLIFCRSNNVFSPNRFPPSRAHPRTKDNPAWELQSYMGYSYEAYATLPSEEVEDDAPDGWSGTVNTNVQVSCAVLAGLTAVVQVSLLHASTGPI